MKYIITPIAIIYIQGHNTTCHCISRHSLAQQAMPCHSIAHHTTSQHNHAIIGIAVIVIGLTLYLRIMDKTYHIAILLIKFI